MSAVPASIALPAVLDQRVAEALSSEIARALAGGGVSLDASGVDRVTTPGVQFLLAAGAAADAAAAPFALAEPSAALASAISTLGLEPRFARWITA